MTSCKGGAAHNGAVENTLPRLCLFDHRLLAHLKARLVVSSPGNCIQLLFLDAFDLTYPLDVARQSIWSSGSF